MLPGSLPSALNVTTFCSATAAAALSGYINGTNTTLAALTVTLKNTGDVSILVSRQESSCLAELLVPLMPRFEEHRDPGEHRGHVHHGEPGMGLGIVLGRTAGPTYAKH